MSRKREKIAPECFDCPLPDCFDTDSRCPLLRRKAGEQGLTLPLEGNAAPVSLERRRHKGIVPVSATDRADYHRQYNHEYNLRFKRIIPPGVKVRRCDLELLEKVAAADGRKFSDELVILIEIMAENARSRGWS